MIKGVFGAMGGGRLCHIYGVYLRFVWSTLLMICYEICAMSDMYFITYIWRLLDVFGLRLHRNY